MKATVFLVAFALFASLTSYADTVQEECYSTMNVDDELILTVTDGKLFSVQLNSASSGSYGITRLVMPLLSQSNGTYNMYQVNGLTGFLQVDLSVLADKGGQAIYEDPEQVIYTCGS